MVTIWIYDYSLELMIKATNYDATIILRLNIVNQYLGKCSASPQRPSHIPTPTFAQCSG